MSLPVILISACIVLCIYGSNFFSSAEMSFSSANEMRLQNEAEDGSGKAKIALYILNHFDNALSTILIGNNLVNIAASSLTSVFILLVTGSDKDTWMGTVGITILIIIFGETIAKISAKKKPNTLAMKFAWPIRIMMGLFFPLVWVVVKLTNLISSFVKPPEDNDEDEYVEAFQSMIETAEDEGVLDSERTELLQAAIDFSDTSAQAVMTSRVDMDAIDIDDEWDEIRAFVRESSHTRIPVYEEGIDNVIGVLHVNHLLKAMTEKKDIDLRELLLPTCFVYKTMKLPEVMDELKKYKQHLAVVTDEYGGTLGVITMEDILEELVGEIWDESDEVTEEYTQSDMGSFTVDGDMAIDDFLELIHHEEDEVESETVGGWCIEQSGHYPKVGEEITVDDVSVKVLSMDGRRVEKLLITILNKE